MMFIAVGDAITVTNIQAGIWTPKGGGNTTPWYMLDERPDGRQPGVIYADGLEGAFQKLKAATWKSGAVTDMAA